MNKINNKSISLTTKHLSMAAGFLSMYTILIMMLLDLYYI